MGEENQFQDAGIVTVYTSDSPLSRPVNLVAEIVSDVWQRRELIWILFLRDLKAQFRQSFLGYAWLIIPPIASAFVWYMMNAQRLVNFDTTVPYPVFVLIGTTLWTAFSATLTAPSDVIFQNREVLVKLNVPTEAFILSGTARAMFNLLVTCGILFPLLWWYGYAAGFRVLLFPLAAMTVLIPAFAIGMCLAPIGALYTDFKNAISPLLGLMMFTAPVVFEVPQGDGLWAAVVQNCPLTPGIALCRDLLVTGSSEWLGRAVVWLVISVAVLFITFVGLRVSKPHIVARMGM